MARRLAVVVTVALVAASVLAPVATAQDDDGVGGALVTPGEFSYTVFELTVFENGTVEWSVTHSRPLANESQVQQFRDYADRFESTETPIYRDFANSSEGLVELGADAAGRPMNATDFSRNARVNRLGQTRGEVTMSFHWSNFARTSANAVRIGDVFEGGFYVGDNQQLTVVRGEGLVFETVQPSSYTATNDSLATSQSVTWAGPVRFTDQRPRVVFQRASTGATDSTGAQTTDDPGVTDAPSNEDDGGPGWAFVGILGVVLVVSLAGAAAVWRSGALEPASPSTDPSDDGESAAETTAARESASVAASAEQDLLSDEDRVVQLIEDRGGRMKQVNIVEETGWSKSKVSMLLSDMEDDGRISKLRVGRENIISLPGHEPDAAGSPFDDEE